MTRRRRALVVALCALGAACAGVLGFRTVTGPRGFEHRAHVLAGVACTRCHTSITTSTRADPLHLPDDATCVGCHAQPHARAGAAVVAARQGPCTACHGDPAAVAAVVDAKQHLRFDHARHAALTEGGQCVRCHEGVSREGERLRPTMGTCLGCHAHRDEFELRACDGCHVDVAAEGYRPVDHVPHDGDFLRGHGVMAARVPELCAACHAERTCAGCHGATVAALPSRITFDDPMGSPLHRAGFRSRHADEARSSPGLCASCHAVETCGGCHASQGIAAGVGRASPHPSGWVGVGGANDHGPAARRDPLACASCHAGPGEAMCASCHRVGGVGGSPHPPGWRSERPRGELPCRMCHTAAR